ncbi:hypothetical protein CPC08DRAFT_402160 [Agrocybe pediades]|nr:hypothetical protein CPC08DRAFT_402160 [Agrocybe pediades]
MALSLSRTIMTTFSFWLVVCCFVFFLPLNLHSLRLLTARVKIIITLLISFVNDTFCLVFGLVLPLHL